MRIKPRLLPYLLIFFLGLSLGGINFHRTAQSQSPPAVEDFTVWCSPAEERSPSAQRTVEALQTAVDAATCQEAAEKLTGVTTLDLSDRQLTDLSPLAPLTHLQALYLGQNQLTDLTPLQGLTQLTALYVLNNQITDLSPIGQLANLSTLSIDNNQIQDLNPLANLSALTILYANSNRIATIDSLAQLENLTELYLADNQITDIQILRSLPQLTHLDLANNLLTQIEPLADLPRLMQLSLNDNRIAQLEALAALSQLTSLDLRNNPLPRKTCPVRPITVCLFSDDAADLYQLGQRQRDRGELLAALTTFRTALQVYRRSGDRLRESDALDRIGSVYDDLGQYANALDAYQQGLALGREIGDRQGESETLAYLGLTYVRLGQMERAIATLQQSWQLYQSLDIAERDWRRQEAPDGVIFSSLALAYSRLGEATPALRFAKYSLANYRYRNDRQGEAIALTRVGEAYLQLGDLDKARLYLNKARDLSQRQADDGGLARSLNGLGRLAAQSGDGETALDRYRQARALWQALEDPAGEGETLNAMGELLLQTGQFTQAVVALQTAVERWESLRPGLTDADKISLAEVQSRTYQLLQQASVELEDIETALEVSERGRARAFAELLAHRLALRGQPTPPERFQPPAIAQIKSFAQREKATIVEYSLVNEDLYTWVVQPAGAIDFHRQPLGSPSLVNRVADSRLALGVGGRGVEVVPTGDTTTAASISSRILQQLYQLLIAPIADALPPEASAPVIIVPQGELFLVPFAALEPGPNAAGPNAADPNAADPNAAGPHLALVDQHALLFAPAISLLTAPQPQRPPLRIGQDPALVVGDPVMPADPSTGEPLPQLTGAAEEAQAIAPLLNTTPLMGQAATKATILADLQDVAIAHFATHGLLDDFGTGIPGALALTPTATDSGFLTAAEIFELPLNAQLVVLSACDTGRGTITGDGVVGLSRSFLTAGVGNVVVSLWAVPDEPTALLMKEFYRHLQQHSSRAIALRQAMLATRQRYSQPSSWAAFAVFGRLGASEE